MHKCTCSCGRLIFIHEKCMHIQKPSTHSEEALCYSRMQKKKVCYMFTNNTRSFARASLSCSTRDELREHTCARSNVRRSRVDISVNVTHVLHCTKVMCMCVRTCTCHEARVHLHVHSKWRLGYVHVVEN